MISGYVIAYSCDKKYKNSRDYIVARFSRVYSALIPALLLTGLLAAVGGTLHPVYALRWVAHDEPLRIILSAFNLQNLWFLSMNPTSNHPLWSLAYECWYYLIFGLFFYLKGAPRYFWGILACLVAGPRILLLFPLWLLGVGCYHLHGRLKLRPDTSRVGLGICSLILAVLFCRTPLAFLEPQIVNFFLSLNPALLCGGHPVYIYELLEDSSHFTYDYLEGVFVFGFFFFLWYALPRQSPPKWFVNLSRGGSSFSYSIYILHYPLLVIGGFLPLLLAPNLRHFLGEAPWFFALPYFVGMIVFAWGFSLVTEKRRQQVAAVVDPCLMRIERWTIGRTKQ